MAMIRAMRLVALCIALLVGMPASASAAGGSPVGWWWTLKGNRPGEKAKVTLLKVVKNVTTDGYQDLARGYNFVGIKVRIKNIGRVLYDDSPSNGAELFTRSGT